MNGRLDCDAYVQSLLSALVRICFEEIESLRVRGSDLLLPAEDGASAGEPWNKVSSNPRLMKKIDLAMSAPPGPIR
jgi:hypothetical protein